MKLPRRLSLAVASLLIVVNAETFAAAPKVEETVVGRSAAQTSLYIVGPRSGQYLVQTPKGERMVMVVDGVEGPECLRLLTPRGGEGIAFSDDGKHHAYFVQLDDGYGVVRDGELIYRGVLTPSNINYHDLKFSPGGKYVYWVDLKSASGTARAELIMNGKPGPACGHQNIFPVFSRNDEHWAYSAVKFGSRTEYLSVVDGKEVPFLGHDLAYTGDGKLLGNLEGAISVDGKLVHENMSFGGKIGPAAVGKRWAAVAKPDKPGGAQRLVIDGKVVPDAEYPEQVIFSPDGKRYMAVCQTNNRRSRCVFIDGKRGPDFAGIGRNVILWTPDSSKAIYVMGNNGRFRVVVEGEPELEFPTLASQTTLVPVSAKGGRYGYVYADDQNGHHLVIDGKEAPLAGSGYYPDTLSFSADGQHYAYITSKRGTPTRYALMFDGVEMPGANLTEIGVNQQMRDEWIEIWGTASKFYVFSPDGKHVAYAGMNTADNRYGVFVDGKPISVSLNPQMSLVSWSADSKHVYWVAQDKFENRPQTVARVYADGLPTPVALGTGELHHRPGSWVIDSAGALRVLVFEGDVAKRYRISSTDGFDVTKAIAMGPPAELAPAILAATPPSPPKPAPTVAAKPPPSQSAAAKTATPAAPTQVAPSGAAPAVALTWNDLVRRPETRPATCTVKRDYNFSGGASVRTGSKVNILEFTPAGLALGTPDGRVNFDAKPDETDVVAVANAAWAQLTLAQRELTYPALLKRQDLWPYRVKLALPFELEGQKLKVGDSVTLLKVEGNDLLVRLEASNIAFNVAPQETDLMAQARGFLAGDGTAPGRVLEEFAGKLISPIDGRPASLDAGLRPKYVVMYMGASWCGPCQVFSPELVKILKEKSPKPEDVIAIYLSGDKTPADMKAYVTKLGIAWPTIRYNNTSQLPAFSPLFGNVIPQLVVTDRFGKVVIDSAKVGQEKALAQLRGLL